MVIVSNLIEMDGDCHIVCLVLVMLVNSSCGTS